MSPQLIRSRLSGGSFIQFLQETGFARHTGEASFLIGFRDCRKRKPSFAHGFMTDEEDFQCDIQTFAGYPESWQHQDRGQKIRLARENRICK